MKIKSKVTLFFLLTMVAFALVVFWVGNSLYRQEMMRLNQEVAKERIDRLIDFIRDQDGLLFDRIYKSPEEAKEKVAEFVKNTYTNLDVNQYLFIVSDDSRYVVHPQISAGGIFIWDRSTVAKMLKSGQGEMIFNDATGRKLVYYSAFRPWDWLICYAVPYEIIEDSGNALQSYLRQGLTVGACIIIGVLMMLLLIRQMLSPLDQLVVSTQALAQGEFPAKPTKAYASDEIGMLASSFDGMALKVKESLHNLHLENEERRKKEQEFRDLIDNSPLAMMVINPDRTYLCNSMFNRIFGDHPTETATINGWLKQVFPDPQYRNNAQISWQRQLNSGINSDETFKMRCLSGEILDMEVRHKLIGNRELLVFNDLSQRKRTETQLRDTRNYLSQVINSVNLLLVATDSSFAITEWNQPMELYSGLNSNDAKKHTLWVSAPFLNNYRQNIEAAIFQRETSNLRRENLIIGGRSGYFNISISPLTGENYGAVIIIEDVTELIKKSEQLFQAQKMETVGTLAGGLAHDFNNILGGIKGSIAMINHHLKSDTPDTGEIKDFLLIAERSVLRATHMVEQLLTLSRRSQLNIRPIDLVNAVSNIIDICRGSFDKKVSIKFSSSHKHALMNGDQPQIEQVLLNLLINAEHAMTMMRTPGDNPGGEISISLARVTKKLPKNDLEQGNACWQIAVSDQGVGIPSDILPKIFDPFFTTKTKGRGTGLGLAMVYGIIESHQGSIEVSSIPGQGSTFTILLPALDETATLSEPTSESDDLVSGEGTILLIDDEADIRRTVGKMLEIIGYQVIAVADGNAGAEIYRESYRDIVAVVLDMAMPRIDGMETFKLLAAINPEVKVLIASGYGNDVRVTKTIDLGARGFIQKPFSINAFSRKIAEIILKAKPA